MTPIMTELLHQSAEWTKRHAQRPARVEMDQATYDALSAEWDDLLEPSRSLLNDLGALLGKPTRPSTAKPTMIWGLDIVVVEGRGRAVVS